MVNQWKHLLFIGMGCVLAFAWGEIATADDWDSDDDSDDVNVVVIAPTPISSDPDEQRLNSMSTLMAFHEAIDGAPPTGRVIQLQPGVYDFSAVVIIDPVGDPPEHYSVGLGGGVHYFNPHGLVGSPPYEELSSGISILGKQHLTITGTPSTGGMPTTIIRGCKDPRCQDFYLSPITEFNVGFSIGGDFEIPSRFVKIENIAFESFAYGIVADSHTPNPNWAFSPARLGEGTEDLLIESNVFTDVLENFIGRKQIRPIVRDNKFIWSDPAKWNAHLAVLGLPNDDHPVEAIIEGNTFDGAGWIAVLLMNNHEGTIVRDNHFKHSAAVQCDFGGGHSIGMGGGWHGVHPVTPSTGLIEDNRIDGGCVGIWVWGSSGWEIRDNTVHNATHGVWTEWGPPWFDLEGIFQPTVAEDNLVVDNDLRFNSYGVFLGARSRNNIFDDNDVRHNIVAGYYLNAPDDFGWIVLGPPSGNIIIDADPQSVTDMSGCYSGPGGCPQIDEDSDGLYSEDPVDNINNDGDSIFGYSMNDEDLEELPNVFISDEDDEDD